jgi:hypothetical protein
MNDEATEWWRSGGAAAVVVGLVAASVAGLTALADTAALRSAVSETPWYVHLGQAEIELDENDFTAATYHWREAYAAAVRGRRAHGLVEVGNFYRRLGARAGLADATARARDCYMTALLRARAERSTDGVLTAAEAFLSLGDEEMVQRGLVIAEDLARRDIDPRARNRVAMLAARVARAAVP